MKGFDTDEKIVEYMKLRQAPRDLHKIVQVIQGASFSKFLYHRSCLPRLKSYLLYPLFLRINIGKNAFHTTDKCLSCGHCEKNCSTKTYE